MTTVLFLAAAFSFGKIYTGGFGQADGFANSPDPYGSPRHCHTFDVYVPFAEHGKAHPEWFSYVKASGRRCGGPGGGQFCFTNPELRAFVKQRLRAYIERDRAEAAGKSDPPRIYDISQNDNVAYCECEACMSAREKWGLSGLLVDFINDVASSVAKDYPDVLVNTFAYQGTEAPPKGGMRAADNVVIRLCDTQSNQAAGRNEPGNTVFRDNLVAWAKCAKNISVWDYFSVYTDDLIGFPYASEFHIGEYTRMCRDNRVIGFFREHEHRHKGDFWELKNYVGVEMMRNPDADDQALVRSFVRDHYGPAADEIYAYRRRLDELRRERKGNVPWFPSLGDWDWLDAAAVAEFQGLFDRALAKCGKDGEFGLRVRRARLGLDRLVCRRALGSGAWDAAATAAAARVKAITPVWYARFAGTEFMRKHPHAVEDDIAQVCGVPPPKRFAGMKIRDFTAPMLYVTESAVERTVRLREDRDSESGRAWIIDADASKHDKLPYEIGFYDREAKKFLARKSFEKPLAKNAYAWYRLGEITVPGPSLVYVSGSWNVQLDLRRRSDLYGKTFDVWVSAKLSGRKFFADDDSPSRISVDRVVFVEPYVWSGKTDEKGLETSLGWFDVEGGGVYSFGCWVNDRIRVKEGKTYRIRVVFDCYDAQNRGIRGVDMHPVAENAAGGDGSVRYEGKTSPLPAEARYGRFRVCVPRDSSGELKVRDLSLKCEGAVVAEYLGADRYRNEVTRGDRIRFQAILHVNEVRTPLDSLEAVFVYANAAGERAERAASEFTAATASAVFAGDELAEGAQKIRLEIRRKAGGTIGSAEADCIRVAQVRRRVRFDRYGRTLVDGKPYFPYGFYSSLRTDTLDRFRGSPFNSIVAYSIPDAAKLDEIRSCGLMVCYNVVSANDRGVLESEIRRVKDHPAILAWYDCDEAPEVRVPALRKLVETVHRIDPDHPLYAVTDKPRLVRPFLGCYDVIGMDAYPVGNRNSRLSLASEWAFEARKAMFDLVPTWHVAQAFNWAFYRGNEPELDMRFPTREEFASLTWQPIAAGANGLFYFCTSFVSDQTKGGVNRGEEFSAAWPWMCEVAAEVKAKERTLLSLPGPAVEACPADMVARTWLTDADEVEALVCNTSRAPARGELRAAGCRPLAVELPALGHAFFKLGKVGN